MKLNILALVISFCVLAPQMGHTRAPIINKQKQKNKQTRNKQTRNKQTRNKQTRNKQTRNKYTDKTLKCVRRIINNRHGGKNAVIYAANYLSQVKKNEKNRKKLKKIYEACKKQRKSLLKHPRLSWYELEDFWKEHQTKYPKEFSTLMLRFIYPCAKCKLGGFDLRLGIAIMLGGGLHFGKCEAENGERFISFAPAGSVGFGVGGAFLIKGQSISYPMHMSERKRASADQMSVFGGIGLAGGSNINGISDKNATTGVGAGLGIGAGVGGEVEKIRPFKLFSLKDDFTTIKDLLFQN